MNKTLIFALVILLFPSSCVKILNKYKGTNSNKAIAQAEVDVKKAKQMHAEWRMLDKAVNKNAENISKMLQIAKQKQAAGETKEATRLAKKISLYVKLALKQAEKQKSAKPHY